MVWSSCWQAAEHERATAAGELEATRRQLQEARTQLATAEAAHAAASEELHRQEAAADALQVGATQDASFCNLVHQRALLKWQRTWTPSCVMLFPDAECRLIRT